MTTWRITVKGEASELEAFKEAHFKKLYQATGDSLIFELPEQDEEGADALVTQAEKEGLVADKERYEDPLEQAEGVDFW